jgi:hypothetical protein
MRRDEKEEEIGKKEHVCTVSGGTLDGGGGLVPNMIRTQHSGYFE